MGAPIPSKWILSCRGTRQVDGDRWLGRKRRDGRQSALGQDSVLRSALEGVESDDGIASYLEYAFIGWYFIELLLKIAAFGIYICAGPDWYWNTFDLILGITYRPDSSRVGYQAEPLTGQG